MSGSSRYIFGPLAQGVHGVNDQDIMPLTAGTKYQFLAGRTS